MCRTHSRIFDPSQVKRLLIVKLSSLGDIVNTLPALSVIRQEFSQAKIGWLVEDRFADLLQGHTAIDHLFIYERQKWKRSLLSGEKRKETIGDILSFYRNLRRFDADVAIDFQGNAKSGIHAFFSGAAIRIGFSRSYTKEENSLFSTHRFEPYGFGPAEQNLSLLKQLGLEREPEGPFLPLSNGRNSETSRIVIHTGTSQFGAFKQWPLSYFECLIRSLLEETFLSLALTWSGKERERVEHLVNEINHPRLSIAPQMTLRELPLYLQQSALFVGNDSGPTHLASLLGVPTVVIFGPKDPGRHGPYGKTFRIIRNDKVPCSPCERRRCPAPLCLSSILPEEVLEAVLILLKNGTTGRPRSDCRVGV